MPILQYFYYKYGFMSLMYRIIQKVFSYNLIHLLFSLFFSLFSWFFFQTSLLISEKKRSQNSPFTKKEDKQHHFQKEIHLKHQQDHHFGRVQHIDNEKRTKINSFCVGQSTGTLELVCLLFILLSWNSFFSCHLILLQKN